MAAQKKGNTSSSARDCAEEIFQLVVDWHQEESGELSADTLVATLAALTGEATRRAAGNMITQEDKSCANAFLSIISDVLTHVVQQTGHKSKDLSSFDSVLEHTLKNPTLQNGPVLTIDPYHTPHQPPAQVAAILREDVLFLSRNHGLSDQECAGACLIALGQAMQQVSHVLPPPVAYQMSMEVAAGVAYMEPLDRSKVTFDKKFFLTKRIIAAANEITRIAIIQNAVLENGRPHPQTLAAKTGAILGELVHRAAARNISERPSYSSADYIVLPDVDQFLEECNVQFMASCIRRGKNIDKLPEYGEYVANAAASIGHDPYPKHNVKEKDRPHSFPVAEASMAREPIRRVAQKYNLSDWELASACAATANDTIRLAEQVTSTQAAFRLVMEEAAAIARIKPLDLDKLMESAPENIRKGMMEMRQRALAAVENGPA